MTAPAVQADQRFQYSVIPATTIREDVRREIEYIVASCARQCGLGYVPPIRWVTDWRFLPQHLRTQYPPQAVAPEHRVFGWADKIDSEIFLVVPQKYGELRCTAAHEVRHLAPAQRAMATKEAREADSTAFARARIVPRAGDELFISASFGRLAPTRQEEPVYQYHEAKAAHPALETAALHGPGRAGGRAGGYSDQSLQPLIEDLAILGKYQSMRRQLGVAPAANERAAAERVIRELEGLFPEHRTTPSTNSLRMRMELLRRRGGY